jgi:hypothetical protein
MQKLSWYADTEINRSTVVNYANGRCRDVTAFPALMQEIDCDPEQMLGDKGYDSEAVCNDIEERAACRVLPPALLHLIVLARARTRIGWLQPGHRQ